VNAWKRVFSQAVEYSVFEMVRTVVEELEGKCGGFDGRLELGTWEGEGESAFLCLPSEPGGDGVQSPERGSVVWSSRLE
jgi:hypothetical protein